MTTYLILILFFLFFFNDTATTEIYTLSLHDALPILRLRAQAHDRLAGGAALQGERRGRSHRRGPAAPDVCVSDRDADRMQDRKSTRLNSSHSSISYAVFCLKKKKNTTHKTRSEHKRT